MYMLKLLTLLADGNFHSGNELGAAAGISRAAVWKRLQGATAEFGLELQSVPGKGYRLSHPLSLIDLNALQANFPYLPIFAYDSISSTNEYAKKNACNTASAISYFSRASNTWPGAKRA